MRSNLLTASRLSTAQTCQRLHHYEYELGYRPASTRAELRFGTLIHAALEQWWLHSGDARLEAALDALHVEADPYDRARAEALILGYHYRWQDDVYEVLGVELEFRAPLVNPETGYPSTLWRLGGKLDVVVRDQRADVWVVEHKTAGSDIRVGSDYWTRLRLDAQCSIYLDGATALGFEPKGVIYDVLGKPTLRPLKATPVEQRKYTQKTGELYANQRDHDETVEEFSERLIAHIAEDPNAIYARGEVVRLEADVEEFRHTLWQVAAQIREASRAGRYPMNTGACWRFGSLCAFLPVCSKAEVLDSRFYERLENVHRELTPDEEEKKNVVSTPTGNAAA